MEMKPLSDMVFLEQVAPEETTQSGIVLPGAVQLAGATEQGKVVAVGPGRVTPEGEHIAMQVKVGDKVIFSRYSPTKIKAGDKEYLVVREETIMAIIN